VNSYHSYRFPLLSTQPVPSVGTELIALISCVGLVMVIWFIRDCDGTTDNGKWLLTPGCKSHRDSGLSSFANLHLAEAVNDSNGMAMLYSHWERHIFYQIRAQVTTFLCIVRQRRPVPIQETIVFQPESASLPSSFSLISILY
jgi:hypothetical protein